MNLNGLWTAEFSTGFASGTGVVVVVNGQILGGDASYYYIGNLHEDRGNIIGDLLVKHFAGTANNVFGGVREVRLKLEGAASENLIRGQAYVPSMPMQRMFAKLARVTTL